MKRTLFVAIVVLTFAITGAAQTDCARHMETVGSLSFCAPEGWVEKKTSERYSQFLGPAREGFTANLNVKEGRSAKPLDDFVAGEVLAILLPANIQKLGATSIDLVNRSEFVTASGLRGFKIEYRTEYKGFLLRQVQYFFEAINDRKLLLTFTSVEAQRDALDPICDDSVRTFRLEK